jgi:hypothetical protein
LQAPGSNLWPQRKRHHLSPAVAFPTNGDIGAQDRILDLWGRALEGYLVDAEMLLPARDMAAGSHLRTARLTFRLGETTEQA